MVIDKVYEQLLNEKLCDSAYDFSQRFLGKSKSYYSVLKSRELNPSFDVILTLESTLKSKAGLYSDRHPIFTRTRNSLNYLADDVKKYREERLKNKIRNSIYV